MRGGFEEGMCVLVRSGRKASDEMINLLISLRERERESGEERWDWK